MIFTVQHEKHSSVVRIPLQLFNRSFSSFLSYELEKYQLAECCLDIFIVQESVKIELLRVKIEE